jgi:glutaredoxin
MKNVLFFTGKNCPACVQAKAWADKHGLTGYKVMDMDVRENAKIAAQYNVMGKPTLLALDGKGQPKRSFHGSSCFSAYVKWKEK